MAIESTCTGCGRTLRVGDENAGKQARCPVCNTIYNVPNPKKSGPNLEKTPSRDAASSGSANSDPVQHRPAPLDQSGSGDGPSWFMKTPEGQTYGPATKPEIDRWVSEGRVTPDCELRTSQNQDWSPAGRYYPKLQRSSSTASGASYNAAPTNPGYSPAAHTGGSGGNPFADHAAGNQGYNTNTGYPGSGYPAPNYPAPRHGPRSRYTVAHRGGLILALGIIGFVAGCPILSVMAWVMGQGDLREIRSGRMDPTGESMTQAGMIIGIIYSLLWLAILPFFGLACCGAAAGG